MFGYGVIRDSFVRIYPDKNVYSVLEYSTYLIPDALNENFSIKTLTQYLSRILSLSHSKC